MLKKKGLAFLVFMLILMGMLFFPYIPILFLYLVGIDYTKFNDTVSVLFNLFCNIGYMAVLFLIYKNKIIKDFKEFKKNLSSNFELAFKYYFIGVILMIVSNLVITLGFSNAVAGNEEAIRELINEFPLYMIFSVSIYAPFVEELIFRHGIKDFLISDNKSKRNRYIYIFTSGFIFAGMGNENTEADFFIIRYGMSSYLDFVIFNLVFVFHLNLLLLRMQVVRKISVNRIDFDGVFIFAFIFWSEAEVQLV